MRSFAAAGTRVIRFLIFLCVGEDGFEISVAPEDAENLCDALFSDSKVIPAGLGARDSLRLEAGLCLHGNDMSAEVTPIEALLMWTVRKQNIKLPHLGQEVLEKLKDVRTESFGLFYCNTQGQKPQQKENRTQSHRKGSRETRNENS